MSAALADALAIRLSSATKIYRLYDSLQQQALDRLGLYALLPWRRPRIREFEALHAVDLCVRRGERVGIVGRNGAGKTTLLKLITGNFPASAGSIEIRGSVQALLQTGLGFHPDFTGMQNVESALLYSGLTGTALRNAIDDVVEFVELGQFLHQPLRTYSLGMCARLQFAAATAVRPDILIIDEVMGAGDGYFSLKSAQRMQRLTSSGCTLLLVSHSPQQVLDFCQRAIWLERGAVRADGDAAEVVEAYERDLREIAEKTLEPAPTRMRVAVPDYLHKPLVTAAITAREPVDLGREHEVEDELHDGRRVHRWPGVTGLRIVDFRVNGAPVDAICVNVGDPLSIEIRARADRAGQYALRWWVTLFVPDGRRIAEVRSPVDRFEVEAGDERIARVSLRPLLAGIHEYLLSLALLREEPHPGGAEPLPERFDLLSRCLYLKVLETNDSDPPMMHYPANWYFGGSCSPVQSRITGVQ